MFCILAVNNSYSKFLTIKCLILITDIVRFKDDTMSVVRHTPDEKAILLVKYEEPPNRCLPLMFKW